MPERKRTATSPPVRDFLFTATISVFEYNFLTIFPHPKAPKTSLEIVKKPIRTNKLSDLVNWLQEDGLLVNNSLWHFALNIRNDIVHFDSHARNSINSPDADIKIFLTENQGVKGELISFVKLIQKLETDYHSLVYKIRN